MTVCVYISLCVGSALALGGQSTALDVILQDAICHGFGGGGGGSRGDGVCLCCFVFWDRVPSLA